MYILNVLIIFIINQRVIMCYKMEDLQKKLEELIETVKNLSLTVEKLQSDNTKLQTIVATQGTQLKNHGDKINYLAEACENTISDYQYRQDKDRGWDPGDSD